MPSRRPRFELVLSFVTLVLAMHDPAAAQEATDRGTGLMVRQALNVKSVLELSGAALCMQTTTQQDIASYFSNNNMEYNPVIYELPEDVFAAYNAGNCDAVAADASALHAARLMLTNPDDHIVLPERLSPE